MLFAQLSFRLHVALVSPSKIFSSKSLIQADHTPFGCTHCEEDVLYETFRRDTDALTDATSE
jgi:hypothetical protein